MILKELLKKEKELWKKKMTVLRPDLGVLKYKGCVSWELASLASSHCSRINKIED